MANPMLGKIVDEWLRANGYDGLYNEGECACSVGDLMPCGEPSEFCTAGYNQPCTCGEHDWHIGDTKEVHVWTQEELDAISSKANATYALLVGTKETPDDNDR